MATTTKSAESAAATQLKEIKAINALKLRRNKMSAGARKKGLEATINRKCNAYYKKYGIDIRPKK